MESMFNNLKFFSSKSIYIYPPDLIKADESGFPQWICIKKNREGTGR